LYRDRVDLKTRGFSGVFVNEDFTRMRTAQFYKACQLAKEQYIPSAWTYDATVKVKERNNKVHRINSRILKCSEKSRLKTVQEIIKK
jgi:hypothetical protein